MLALSKAVRQAEEKAAKKAADIIYNISIVISIVMLNGNHIVDCVITSSMDILIIHIILNIKRRPGWRRPTRPQRPARRLWRILLVISISIRIIIIISSLLLLLLLVVVLLIVCVVIIVCIYLNNIDIDNLINAIIRSMLPPKRWRWRKQRRKRKRPS